MQRINTVAVVFSMGFGIAQAADIGVEATKLIVVDKLTSAGKAKVVFVSKDKSGAITKGAGTDPAMISATFDFGYMGNETATVGQFIVPAGALSGSGGWKANKDTVAKYVNKEAPDGSSEAKVAVIKPAKLLKLVGNGLGDTPIDLLTAGAPATSVLTAYTVENEGETNRHCTAFPTCGFKEIAGGTGRKLVCKNGLADPTCDGTATTTTTLPCTPIGVAPCTDDGDCCAGGVCNAGICDSGTASTTVTSTTVLGTTTSTTLGPCGDDLYPTCGGTCPSGETCEPVLVAFEQGGGGFFETEHCSCVTNGQSCDDTGQCSFVTDLQCQPDWEAVFGNCSRIGSCPDGEVCAAYVPDMALVLCSPGNQIGIGSLDMLGCFALP